MPTQHDVLKGTYSDRTQFIQTPSSYSAHKTRQKYGFIISQYLIPNKCRTRRLKYQGFEAVLARTRLEFLPGHQLSWICWWLTSVPSGTRQNGNANQVATTSLHVTFKLIAHYRLILPHYQCSNELQYAFVVTKWRNKVVVTKQFQDRLTQKQHQNGTDAVFKQFLRDRSKQNEDKVIVCV